MKLFGTVIVLILEKYPQSSVVGGLKWGLLPGV